MRGKSDRGERKRGRDNIILIGMPACGKSVTGVILDVYKRQVTVEPYSNESQRELAENPGEEKALTEEEREEEIRQSLRLSLIHI